MHRHLASPSESESHQDASSTVDDSDIQTTTGMSFPRRPNGRAAACDPCRARKLACNHARPVCSRCRRRNQASLCTYTASTARAQGGGRPLSVSKEPVPAPAFSNSNATQDAAIPNGETDNTKTGSNETATIEARRPHPGFMAHLSGVSGFFSHNDPLEETRESFLLPIGGGSYSDYQTTPHGTTQSPGSIQGAVSFCQLPIMIRETCFFVLKTLLYQSKYHIYFDESGPAPEGWIHIAVDRIVRSLQAMFAEIRHKDCHEVLEPIAERICNNTLKPFRDDLADPDQWIGQFCGENLRWESIGLLWPYLERITDLVDSFRCRSFRWIEGKAASETARMCLDYCIQIARHLTTPNDLLLDLCRRKATLDSVIDGDGSMSSFGSHGVSATMMTFLGLHALGSESRSYRPSICSENKRRIVCSIFISDKLGATFTGRPPLISRRYMSTPLPLDIPDADLAGDESTLFKAVQSLDSQGWNTDGAIYPSTVMRARCMIALVRDEIIEVALNNGAHISREYLLDIASRQMALAATFPSQLHYNPDDLQAADSDVEKLYLRSIVYLEHLINMFFVERLLLRHNYKDEGHLLVTSFCMVTLTLHFWIHKDRFAATYIQRNFEWFILAYAAPGSGILCQELLRPTFRGTHPGDPRLTRSTIVQQLSLLIIVLDWLRPSELSANCRNIIQQVLDQHLNGDPDPVPGVEISQDWGLLTQPDFNFELMDTFGWLRPET